MHFNIGMFSLFEKDAFEQQAMLQNMMIDIHLGMKSANYESVLILCNPAGIVILCNNNRR